MKTKKCSFKLDTAESVIVWLIVICLIGSLCSCGVACKGSCSGNKTMAFYGGYSRSAFNK